LVFAERGFSLVTKGGYLGYILPNKLFHQEYAEAFRNLVADNKAVKQIVDFTDQQVFEQGTTYTCLLFLARDPQTTATYTKVENISGTQTLRELEERLTAHTRINSRQLTGGPWVFTGRAEAKLLERIANHPTLDDLAEHIFVGLQTSADKVYILDHISSISKSKVRVYSKALQEELVLEQKSLKPLVSGVDIKQFAKPRIRQYVLFPYVVSEGRFSLIPWTRLKKGAPLTAQYLLSNKRMLEDREKGKARGPKWYGYIYQKNMGKQELPKICVPRLVKHVQAYFDAAGEYYLDNVDVGGIILKDPSPQHYRVVTAVLNSKLLTFQLRRVSTRFRGGFFSCNRQYLERLNIAANSSATAKLSKTHDKIQYSNYQLARLPPRHAKRQALEDQIKRLTARLDKLVYSLYGLTKEEIALVEKAVPRKE